jgi:arylsulfatase A-like enzyme
LKKAGYNTGYIGKWHLDGQGREAYIPPERRQGFDYWKAAECTHDYHKSHYYAGSSEEKRFWEGYDAYAQTKDAQQYIRDHSRDDKPFVLFVSYGIPHFPHGTAPEELKALYPPEKIHLRPNVPAEMQTPQVRRDVQGYNAHITALDTCIGEVMQAIADAGIKDDTIVVFSSDHGEMMGSHGIKPSTKQVPWDESARVPFLLRYPRKQAGAGRVAATPLTTPDIMPMLLGLAGVAIPNTVEGADLSGVVRGKEMLGHDALYMAVAPFTSKKEWNKEYRAIRTDRYTYVRGLEGPWMLFDDVDDPCQTNNLAGQPAHAALCQELDKRLQARLEAVHDEFRPAAFYKEKFGHKRKPGISKKTGDKRQGKKLP